MFARNRRSGFTLPEVLVTVAIIAVLAAVVVPSVVQQVNKGNAPSFASDINGLQTAVTTFASDTRQFPGTLDELIGSSITTGQNDIFATAFSSAAVAGFHGPYLTTGQTPAGNAATGNRYVMPGYNAITFQDTLLAPSATNACGGTSTSGYVALRDSVKAGTGLQTGTLVTLDSAIDNGSGSTAGSLRWWASSPPAVDSVYYCLITVTKS